jgi:hypothetical protein
LVLETHRVPLFARQVGHIEVVGAVPWLSFPVGEDVAFLLSGKELLLSVEHIIKHLSKIYNKARVYNRLYSAAGGCSVPEPQLAVIGVARSVVFKEHATWGRRRSCSCRRARRWGFPSRRTTASSCRRRSRWSIPSAAYTPLRLLQIPPCSSRDATRSLSLSGHCRTEIYTCIPRIPLH